MKRPLAVGPLNVLGRTEIHIFGERAAAEH